MSNLENHPVFFLTIEQLESKEQIYNYENLGIDIGRKFILCDILYSKSETNKSLMYSFLIVNPEINTLFLNNVI